MNKLEIFKRKVIETFRKKHGNKLGGYGEAPLDNLTGSETSMCFDYCEVKK